MFVRVAAVQFALGKKSYQEAIESAKNHVKIAAEQGAKLVCFPEHWLLEYRKHGHLALEQLTSTAQAAKIVVITGANYAPNNPSSPELRVRSFVIDSDGKQLGNQDKVHLYGSEKKVAAPGQKLNVIQTTYGRIGILICYDCMFPEAARTLALNGADILFVPSRIGSAALDPWILYLRTRSMENRIPVIAPNVFRPPRYVGGSVIIDLQSEGNVISPKIITSVGAGEKIAVGDVNVQQARELRRERFLDRQPTTYFGH